MKIEKKNNSKKKIIISLATLLVLVAGYLVFSYTQDTWPFNHTPSGPSQDKPEDKSDADSNDTQLPSDTDDPNKTPVEHEQVPSPSNDSTIDGVINYKSVNNGTLSIRATINRKLDTGSCLIELTNKTTGKTVQRSAEIVANPSSATCKGFDIPTSELSPGSWKIVITINSNNETGEITGEVSI